jgi:hypothetical protein
LPFSDAAVGISSVTDLPPGSVTVVGCRSGDLCRDDVHGRRADELGDEEVGRALVEFQRRADLLDMPAESTTMRSASVIASTWSWVT